MSQICTKDSIKNIQNNYCIYFHIKKILPLKFISWFRSWKRSQLGQAEYNCQSIYNSHREISTVEFSRKDEEVMEKEIIEDSDKEGDNETGESMSLIAIM